MPKSKYQISTPTGSMSGWLSTRVISHLREPLFWNGYALILSSLATSLLGLVYWGIAAKTYSADVVGINTAAMSAMQLLSLLSQLGMVNVANRFVPMAGKATERLVVICYAIAFVTTFCSSLVFVLGIQLWEPSLSFIQSNPFIAVFFIASTMGWVIFVIQDAVLVGLRQATWVPIENIVFAVAKVALLVVFVSLIPSYGIFASWVIPSVLILIPTNILIFKYLIPRHVRNAGAGSVEIKAAAVVRFIAGNYLSTLIWNATISIIPLVVFSKVGPENSAYFYLAWTIAFALHLVSTNMNMSFLAEVASDSAKLASHSFRTWLQTIVLLLPAVIVIEIGAPLILQIFGGNYSAGGATLLRLLALATIGYSFTAHFLELSRARQRIRNVIIIQAILCSLILVLGYIFLDIWGTTGLGIAWLIAHTTVGAFLMVTQLSKMWLPQLKKSEMDGILPGVRVLFWKLRHRNESNDALRLVPQVITEITSSGAVPLANTWNQFTVVHTVTDKSIVTLGPTDGMPQGFLKIPRTAEAEQYYFAQRAVLHTLKNDKRLAEIWNLLPDIIAEGTIDGRHYSVERAIGGVNAEKNMKLIHWRSSPVSTAAQAIRKLHLGTASEITVDDAILSLWVDRRADILEEMYASAKPGCVSRASIAKLRGELQTALLGKCVYASWVHGDYWLGNINVSLETGELTGLFDWEHAAALEIPMCDLLLLIISKKASAAGVEIGDVVSSLLTDESLTGEDLSLFQQEMHDFTKDSVDFRTLLLLTWLRHVSNKSARSLHLITNWIWIYKNVETVLRRI